jgi:hypothetical protein
VPEATRIRKFLVAARLTLGFLALVVPRTLAKFLGVQPSDNPALPMLTRLFGIREALMAYQLYQASDEELEEVLRQGLLVDGVDSVTVALALLHGEISFRTFLMIASAAGTALASGVLSRQPAPATH